MSYSPTLGRFLERDPIGSVDPQLAGAAALAALQSAAEKIEQALGANARAERWLYEYADGMNVYEFTLSNPLTHVDPSGLLVQAGFDKRTGTLTVKDMDTDAQAEVSQVFTGGVFMGVRYQAIPDGTYEILERKGKPGWYRLDPVDSCLRNDQWDEGPGKGRKEFRLHEGGTSYGCITVPNARTKEYAEIRRVIDGTKTDVQKDRRFGGNITRYGWVSVYSSPPATQPTTKPAQS